MDVQHAQSYYEQLAADLKRREPHLASVINSGETLLLARHPAANVIEVQLSRVSSTWAWLQELTSCFELHLRFGVARIFWRKCLPLIF